MNQNESFDGVLSESGQFDDNSHSNQTMSSKPSCEQITKMRPQGHDVGMMKVHLKPLQRVNVSNDGVNLPLMISSEELTPLTPAFNKLVDSEPSKVGKSQQFEQMLVSGIRSSILNERNLNLSSIREKQEE